MFWYVFCECSKKLFIGVNVVMRLSFGVMGYEFYRRINGGVGNIEKGVSYNFWEIYVFKKSFIRVVLVKIAYFYGIVFS